MNWGFRNVYIGNAPLTYDGRDIYPAVEGIPVQPISNKQLHPHYGGKAWTAANAPADYAGFDVAVRSRNDLYPTDTMGFGGYHGGNFLERDAKHSTWKHQ